MIPQFSHGEAAGITKKRRRLGEVILHILKDFFVFIVKFVTLEHAIQLLHVKAALTHGAANKLIHSLEQVACLHMRQHFLELAALLGIKGDLPEIITSTILIWIVHCFANVIASISRHSSAPKI